MIRARVLWGLFFGIVVLGLLYIFQIATGQVQGSLLNLTGVNLTAKLILVLASTLLILHSMWTLGLLRSTLFLSLGFSTGLVSEIFGVRFGTIFGGHYLYNPSIHPGVMGVPLVIPVVWAGFIYAGYCVVSSCQAWAKRENSNEKEEPFPKAEATALGALAIVAIDLLMEPLQVMAGNWTWFDNGPYFRIPTGNFLGWFLVSFLCLWTFQTLRWHFPRHKDTLPADIHLIPVMGYGLLGFVLAGWALTKGLALLALIGALAMGPGVILNLYLFSRWQKRQNVVSPPQLAEWV
jgi:uncharacterized membrane protein